MPFDSDYFLQSLMQPTLPFKAPPETTVPRRPPTHPFENLDTKGVEDLAGAVVGDQQFGDVNVGGKMVPWYVKAIMDEEAGKKPTPTPTPKSGGLGSMLGRLLGGR